MTIEECYTAMGANYQDVLRRFYKPDMIRRFARMFLQDTSFQQLTDAMARQDVKDAFLAAHTLKGVCLNLGFSNLMPSAVALTEILRAGSFDGAAGQTPEEAEAEFLTDEYFDQWYESTKAALEAYAG